VACQSNERLLRPRSRPEFAARGFSTVNADPDQPGSAGKSENSPIATVLLTVQRCEAAADVVEALELLEAGLMPDVLRMTEV
jgi:hypothetical protein